MLKVENLCKRFGHAEVLCDISFTLREGESLAILGSSGSGKTTLLRCLNFLERPDKGRISVRDELLFEAAAKYDDSSIRSKRLHFGFVFQAFNLFPQYTALKNITLARELAAKESPEYAKNKKALHEKIYSDGLDLLEQMGLSARGDYYPHQLSGGQQQRVAIARALALRPDILCFDEPTSALDPELTGEVLRVIKSLADKRTTMLIVTHEMQFARQIADTILFMDEGMTVEYGTPEEVMDNPKTDRMKRFLEHYSGDV
ncbi:MAG: amino acid ABC transporter ATP-binding protein [Lachnospiraceae bacterium]|nr:amino acid ABC transporter ATP-binding protein [Lachnospiraceae bacterium]